MAWLSPPPKAPARPRNALCRKQAKSTYVVRAGWRDQIPTTVLTYDAAREALSRGAGVYPFLRHELNFRVEDPLLHISKHEPQAASESQTCPTSAAVSHRESGQGSKSISRGDCGGHAGPSPDAQDRPTGAPRTETTHNNESKRRARYKCMLKRIPPRGPASRPMWLLQSHELGIKRGREAARDDQAETLTNTHMCMHTLTHTIFA